MGAAAAPVVGGIITAVLVSEAIKAVGPKLGLSDDVVGITATVAGAYAGGMTYNSAMTASASGTATGAGAGNQVGFDLSLPTQGADLSIAGSDMAPSGMAPGLQTSGAFTSPVDMSALNAPAVPLGGTGQSAVTTAPVQQAPKNAITINSDPNAVGGGMLSKAAPPPPAPTTAQNTVDAAVTPNADGGEKTWYEKLFTPEKTMDLLMAGMTGYASAGMAKDDREYPEEIAKNNAKDWGKAYPGMLSLSQQYPSQQ